MRCQHAVAMPKFLSGISQILVESWSGLSQTLTASSGPSRVAYDVCSQTQCLHAAVGSHRIAPCPLCSHIRYEGATLNLLRYLHRGISVWAPRGLLRWACQVSVSVASEWSFFDPLLVPFLHSGTFSSALALGCSSFEVATFNADQELL